MKPEKYKKKKLKQTNNKRQCPFNSVQVKIREGSPGGNKSDWRKAFVKEMSFKSGLQDNPDIKHSNRTKNKITQQHDLNI